MRKLVIASKMSTDFCQILLIVNARQSGLKLSADDLSVLSTHDGNLWTAFTASVKKNNWLAVCEHRVCICSEMSSSWLSNCGLWGLVWCCRTCGYAWYVGLSAVAGTWKAMRTATSRRRRTRTPWSWAAAACGTTPVTTTCTGWCRTKLTANWWRSMNRTPANRRRRSTLSIWRLIAHQSLCYPCCVTL